MSSPRLLVVLLLLSLWCVSQVHTQDGKKTLRLCGRALLRAVVFTCGGSRWKRLMGGKESPPDELLWTPVHDRHWRDQNQALISTCCQLGCHRGDLSMLC